MMLPELDVIQSMLDTGDLTAADLGSLKFSAGSTLFNQGDDADCSYMIDTGYVEVSRRTESGKDILAVLGPGEIIGEIAVLDGLPRSATATALHDTSVILIPRDQLMRAVDNAGPLARLVLMASNNRLRAVQTVTTVKMASPASHVQSVNASYDSSRNVAARHLRQRLALANALSRKEFALVYQPIVSLVDGRTAGFEALIRWRKGDQTVVSPAEFIPLAEESGLILPMGIWVLERALHTLHTMDRRAGRKRDGGNGVFMSVNVSPRQLESEGNVEQLARMIEQADINPARIKIEITEQALLDDPRMATLSLARLKASGASIAIDDFGTGYSSLSYLHRFPLDTLKIDQSFIAKIGNDPSAERIVAAIIALAHELGMDIVAEGIEAAHEMHWLQRHACRFGQGYFMARPSALADALPYLDRHFEW